MASQQEYSFVTNALVALIHQSIALLPGWEQGFIPMDKIPEAAGQAAKTAVDALDQYRAAHPPIPQPAPAPAATPLRAYRRRK